MRWSIPALIALLVAATSSAQDGAEKADPVRAALKLGDLAVEVAPADRPGEVLLTVNKGEAAKFEIPKFAGTVTRLSACPWNGGRGVAVAVEARSAKPARSSYHWLTIDVVQVEGKATLKLAGVSGDAFLSDLPHEYDLGITNPRGDTIHILLTRKDAAPPGAVGHLYVHDCPVGAFGTKRSAYAKLYELRAREVK